MHIHVYPGNRVLDPLRSSRWPVALCLVKVNARNRPWEKPRETLNKQKV